MPSTLSSQLRLDAAERRALARALAGVEGRFFLFGSRTDPTKKGGDIDLLVVSEADSAYKLEQEITVRFQMELDTKIDVTVVTPSEFAAAQTPFLQLIYDDLKEIRP